MNPGRIRRLSFLRLGKYLGAIAITLFVSICPVSIWAMDCFVHFNREVIEIPSSRLEFHRESARNVRTFQDFINVFQLVAKDNLSRDEITQILSEVTGVPQYLNKSGFVEEVTSSRYISEDKLRDIFVGSGVEWLQLGRPLSDIQSCQWTPQKIKNYIFDIAKVKRSRNQKLSPLEKSLIWEAEYNDDPQFRRTSLPIPLLLHTLPTKDVRIIKLASTPNLIISEFINSDQVLLPQNPFNSFDQVPFYKAPKSVQQWKAYLTASRTMYVIKGQQAFAVKTPTDYTNPYNYYSRNYLKTDLREDIAQGLSRSEHIEKMDLRLGLDPRLKVLKDVFAVFEPNSKNGFVVRDLSPLLDGHDYIPGSAIMSVTRELGLTKMLAALRKSAVNQGRAQALFLLRYALQMETPHRQNSLERTNPDLSIAETTVLRDVADSMIVPSLMRYLSPDLIERDRELSINFQHLPQPDMQYVGALSLHIKNKKVIEHLSEVLAQSYYQTISQELGIPNGLSVQDPEFITAFKRYHGL